MTPACAEPPLEGVLFFSACCVYGCDVTVEVAAPDCMSFTVNAAITGVPVDAPYAVAQGGVIDGVVKGMSGPCWALSPYYHLERKGLCS